MFVSTLLKENMIRFLFFNYFVHTMGAREPALLLAFILAKACS